MIQPDSRLRILVLEDNPDDFELIVHSLQRDGLQFEVHRVQTESLFLSEVDGWKPDLILSDFSMPSFDGLTALRLYRERSGARPFIFVSGTLGEEVAVEALRSGATDYLVKGHLARLPQAVRRAIGETRQKDERSRLEAQLQHAMKMEAVGRMAGGIAHDFNNLLTAILGYGELLLRSPEVTPSVKDGLGEIVGAGRRASDLTRQLLAFSRKQILDLQIGNLNQIVSGAEKLLRRIIGEDVELVVRLDPKLPTTRVDTGQIEQVVVNLAVNSRDAMPAGGRITIATRSAHLEKLGHDDVEDFKPGMHAILEVADTGTGMDAATLERIFEPFFTTKPAGKGTGLGLATVYGIVRQSGGFIRVESEPDKGTIFRVYLPAAYGAVREKAPTPPPATLKGVETVLLVEDDEGVRRYACSVLSDHGYHVLAAANGGDALEQAARSDAAPNLIVCDLVLPRMGGRELAIRLRQLFPAARFLFVSGYSSDSVPDSSALGGAKVDFLPKPFTPAELLGRARALLDTV